MSKKFPRQQSIHKAFAAELDAEDKALFDKVQKENPKCHMAFVSSPEAKAIVAGNAKICEYFFMRSDAKDAFTFATDRTKSVAQTASANVLAYKSVLAKLGEETEEDYKAVYSALKRDFEKYFEIAAEGALEDYYGTRYTDFRAKMSRDA